MLEILLTCRPKKAERILRGETSSTFWKNVPAELKQGNEVVVWICVAKTGPLLWDNGTSFQEYLNDGTGRYQSGINYDILNGKVVAKFLAKTTTELTKLSSWTEKEIFEALSSSYLVPITSLEIFNAPVPLEKFKSYQIVGKYDSGVKIKRWLPVKKAPSTWCYVQSPEGGKIR